MSVNEATSPSLLIRAVCRDASAWGQLDQLYRPLVVHWCRIAGVGPSDQDDIAQEVMYAVSVGLDNFSRERLGSFRAWVKAITRFKCLDWHRRRAGRPVAGGGTTALERLNSEPSPDDLDDSDEAEAAWLYRRAVEFVRGEFAESTWQAFWRTAIEDRPTDVVAAELGVTPVTVRVAKSRVLNRLRAEVGDVLD